MKKSTPKTTAPQHPFLTLMGDLGSAMESVHNAKSVTNLLIDLAALAPSGARLQIDADGLDTVLRQLQANLAAASARLSTAGHAAADWQRAGATAT